MSRNHYYTTVNTVFTKGSDHVLGSFIQISDLRYAVSGEDIQGEGYVFEWDETFGITLNLIGATLEDMKDEKTMQQLVDEFCKNE